jgi:ParB/RepB/Spo0J family partition protein
MVQFLTFNPRKKPMNANRNDLISKRNIVDLRPNLENQRIYDDTYRADPDLIESIRAKGVLVPLLVTQNNQIVAGHRRWYAAKLAGLAEVPVTVFASDDPLDVLEALVHSNKQRRKSKEQIGREASALLRVERERAKRRQATSTGGSTPQLQEHVPEADEKGQARDKVGEALGISGKTAERAAEVAEVINKLQEGGQDQKAEELRTVLNTRSIGAAHKKATEDGHVEANQRGSAVRSPGGKKARREYAGEVMYKLIQKARRLKKGGGWSQRGVSHRFFYVGKDKAVRQAIEACGLMREFFDALEADLKSLVGP